MADSKNLTYADGYHIHITSTNRDTGTDADFSIAINIPEPPTGMEFNRICLVDASIPRTWLEVDAPYNTFQISETVNGVTQTATVTVTPANYELQSWCTYIPPMMTAASPHGWVYTASRLVPDIGLLQYQVKANGAALPPTSSASIITGTYMQNQVGFPVNSTIPFVTAGGQTTVNTTQVFNSTGEYALRLLSDIACMDGDNIIADIYGVTQTRPLGSIAFQAQHPRLQTKRFLRGGGNSFRFTVISATSGRIMNFRGCPMALHFKVFRQEDTIEHALIRLLKVTEENQRLLKVIADNSASLLDVHQKMIELGQQRIDIEQKRLQVAEEVKQHLQSPPSDQAPSSDVKQEVKAEQPPPVNTQEQDARQDPVTDSSGGPESTGEIVQDDSPEEDLKVVEEPIDNGEDYIEVSPPE
jgi:hypothetical protein